MITRISAPPHFHMPFPLTKRATVLFGGCRTRHGLLCASCWNPRASTPYTFRRRSGSQVHAAIRRRSWDAGDQDPAARSQGLHEAQGARGHYPSPTCSRCPRSGGDRPVPHSHARREAPNGRTWVTERMSGRGGLPARFQRVCPHIDVSSARPNSCGTANLLFG
jgi:hypothetical protein